MICEAKVKANLARRQMHEDVKNFDTLLHRGDCLKRRYYEILHHHLQVLDSVAEPAMYRDRYFIIHRDKLL